MTRIKTNISDNKFVMIREVCGKLYGGQVLKSAECAACIFGTAGIAGTIKSNTRFPRNE
jgi:hypothetical protein